MLLELLFSCIKLDLLSKVGQKFIKAAEDITLRLNSSGKGDNTVLVLKPAST